MAANICTDLLLFVTLTFPAVDSRLRRGGVLLTVGLSCFSQCNTLLAAGEHRRRRVTFIRPRDHAPCGLGGRSNMLIVALGIGAVPAAPMKQTATGHPSMRPARRNVSSMTGVIFRPYALVMCF